MYKVFAQTHNARYAKCFHRPIVIINQQYTKGEIHFIYLHYFYVFWFCFINRNHWNGLKIQRYARSIVPHSESFTINPEKDTHSLYLQYFQQT